MTDEILRSMERAASRDANDTAAREALERAWIRAGRGWSGERLVRNDRGNMAVSEERGVLRWLMEPIAALGIQLVYVPGGETECRACGGTGWNSWHGYSGPERDGCEECHDPKPGVKTIKPFYISRYPVSWREYRTFCEATIGERIPTFPWEELRPENSRHPVVRVTYDDAVDFCEWSGLRLPTRYEWSWAALGPKVAHGADEHLYENENSFDDEAPLTTGKCRCLRCGDAGVGLHERPCMRRRRYPWGDDPASDDRCVWSGHTTHGRRFTAPLTSPWCVSCGAMCEAVARTGRRLACCHACSQDGTRHEERPARPAGASWCGAHDMAGNVWEWRSDASCLGGSFMTEGGPQLYEDLALSRRLFDNNGLAWTPGFQRSDIGFRVAISANGGVQ